MGFDQLKFDWNWILIEVKLEWIDTKNWIGFLDLSNLCRPDVSPCMCCIQAQAKCVSDIQGSAKRRGCLLSYSQAEPGRELTQPIPRLLAEPCT